MRRRALLEALGATAAGGAAASLVGSSTTAGRRNVFEPLDRVAVEGAAEAVVGPDGTTVYVAAGDGFAVVDVADPAAPAVVAQRRDLLADREDGPMTSIRDVAVEGDRLVVPGPADPAPSRPHGFLLYDVADPTDPRQLAFVETGYAIHNTFVRDGYVYVVATLNAAENHLVVFDASDDDPRRVGEWSLEGHDETWVQTPSVLIGLHDVWVQDDVAYLAYWDAGTWLLDVSDPAEPAPVTAFGGQDPAALDAHDSQEAVFEALLQTPGNSHYVRPNDDGTVVGVGVEAWDADAEDDAGGPGGVELWDLAEPTAPTRLATVDPPRATDETRGGTWTTAHNFAFVGDYLLTSWYQGGVKIHDVSDPADPVPLSWWRRPDEAAFWTARAAAGETFVASSHAVAGKDLFEGVYTFPVAAGRQPDPPSLTDGPPKTVPPTPTPTATSTDTSSPTSTTDGGLSPGVAGAGAVAAAAVGAAAWRRFRDVEGEPPWARASERWRQLRDGDGETLWAGASERWRQFRDGDDEGEDEEP